MTAVTANSISLAWDLEWPAASFVIFFSYSIRECVSEGREEEGAGWEVVSVTGSTRTFHLTGLQEDSDYFITVQAILEDDDDSFPPDPVSPGSGVREDGFVTATTLTASA